MALLPSREAIETVILKYRKSPVEWPSSSINYSSVMLLEG
jgi:hypothetical protein